MKPATAPKPTSSSNWKFGNFFSSKTTTTPKLEETAGQGSRADAIKQVHWTEKIKGLSDAQKAKVLEAELKAMEEQLKDNSNTITCLREIHSGLGLKSSTPDFHNVKDKDCRQLIQDMHALYRELEDFNQAVNSEPKAKYEPPVAPVAKLMVSANGNAQHHKRVGSHPKLATIRSNWEENNLKIIDLNKRLKAAYDYINEQKGKTPTTGNIDMEAPITMTKAVKNQSAPKQEKKDSSFWTVPDEKGVDKKQKNMLLSLVGENASDSEEEDLYKAMPAKSYYEPPEIKEQSVPTLLQAKVYNETYFGGKKPDWLDESGEIHITPVKATFINSVATKAEKMHEAGGHMPPREAVNEPLIRPSVPPPKTQAAVNNGSQKVPIDKIGKEKSNASDITESGSRHSSSSYNFYTPSKYQHQSDASGGYQSQMKPSTTGSSYRTNQPQVQSRTTTGNVRQSSNGYSSDVD
ncbi:hypothetical protein Aperf_G00000092607 [Anoplocephala perfoliata]